ncbi:MAG: hypothetical protein Q8Q88_13575 [Phenylobacterium sp.]|uniref:hypothetical protein n=1 Tax=Phenylobacterium sp. TaxID=1871053 RepID=UPI002736FC9D|nr:hypothetical protein [Phenylobacterium sp.]MDP3748067.1 hypothetical protein [Phenylobacterium sp.]
MRAINLHLPHLHIPRVGRPLMPRRAADAHVKTHGMPTLGNAWALVLAAIVAIAVLIGLWMSGNVPMSAAEVPQL